jgi:hypothetical protein
MADETQDAAANTPTGEQASAGQASVTPTSAEHGAAQEQGRAPEGAPPTADASDPSAPDVPADRVTLQDEVDGRSAQNPFDTGNQGEGTTNYSSAAPTAATDREPITSDDVNVPLADLELPPLGPPNPEPRTPDERQAARNDLGQIGTSPEELQKAGQSPADLEIPGLGQTGPAIIVKQNPETPSVHQIAGALSAVPGLPETRVTVHDGNDNEIPHALGTDDRALIGSRANATLVSHPAHAQAGHWSNPNLRDMTDEERTADGEAYAERFGS